MKNERHDNTQMSDLSCVSRLCCLFRVFFFVFFVFVSFRHLFSVIFFMLLSCLFSRQFVDCECLGQGPKHLNF